MKQTLFQAEAQDPPQSQSEFCIQAEPKRTVSSYRFADSILGDIIALNNDSHTEAVQSGIRLPAPSPVR